MAEEVFSLSRVVRTFGTERQEGERYLSYLRRLAHISSRQAAAYFMYLTTASVLYYITKARTLQCIVSQILVMCSKLNFEHIRQGCSGVKQL